MSQLHQEALRKQQIINSRRRNRQEVSNSGQKNVSGTQETNHSPSQNGLPMTSRDGHNHNRQSSSRAIFSTSSNSQNHTPSTNTSKHSSANWSLSPESYRNAREREVMNPYFQNLKKETKARVRNRYSSLDYLMQW